MVYRESVLTQRRVIVLYSVFWAATAAAQNPAPTAPPPTETGGLTTEQLLEMFNAAKAAKGSSASKPANPIPDEGSKAMGTVEGLIVNWKTGVGIPAQISFDSEKAVYKTEANESGHFQLQVPLGSYRLKASSKGFGADASISRGPLQPDNLYVVDSAQAKSLNVALVPLASIGGVISLSADTPAAMAHVRLLRRQLKDGVVHFLVSDATETDVRGGFHFSNIQDGHYIIAAGPPKTALDGSEGPTETFLGQSYTPANAQLITVAHGETNAVLNIRLLKTTMSSISGKIVNDPDAGPSAKLALLLAPEDGSTPLFSASKAQIDKESGEFILNDVPPGDYLLRLMRMAEKLECVGSWPVSVGKIDVKGVELVVRRPANILGSISVGSPRQPTEVPSEFGSLSVLLSDWTGGMLAPGAEARVDPATKGFSLHGLPTGKFRLRLSGAPAGYYLDEVLLNGKSVGEDHLDLLSGLEYTLSLRFQVASAAISGTVPSPHNGLPTIVLLPRAKKIGQPTRYTAEANPLGSFSVTGLPPGEYYVLAVNHFTSEDWDAPEMLSNASREGLSVSVKAGETHALRLDPVEMGRLSNGAGR